MRAKQNWAKTGEESADALGADGAPATQTMKEEDHSRSPMFAPFPKTGIWTTLGLSRNAFFGILTLSVVVYLFWGGTLWNHLGEDDFDRIIVSYSLIPILVGAALWQGRTWSLANFVVASGVLCTVKLVVTAVLALLFDLEWIR